MNLAEIVALWIGYCALHSVLISTSVTALMTRVLKKYYAFYRLAYVVLSFVLLIPLINATSAFEGAETITYAMPFSLLREVLMWGSIGLFAWAFLFDYDPLSFFGVRQIMAFGATPSSGAGGTIKRKGLLGIIRHPMYLMLIMYLWSQIFTVTDLVVNIVLTMYVLIGTQLEEKKLVLEFGDEYVRYQQDVPMLIPFSKRKTAKIDA
jgi:protein-S-isoprenylcysteine O-methyltransferase Ste14